MQIQVGRGPWASEVSGLVKIGQTMTMVLAIKDDDSKFDMLVRNCMAHDGKRAPIQLVDQRGCVTRPKLMSRFTKIKNFGASASVLSYAHFQVCILFLFGGIGAITNFCLARCGVSNLVLVCCYLLR